jgi:uncharacterized membrane protein
MYSNAAIIIAIALNILALVYKFFPPKSINTLYGFHTRSSMRNQDTWNEANTYASRLMLLLSILFLLAAIISGNLLSFSARELAIYAVTLIIACAALYFLTEAHLRNVFDEGGRRK